MKSSIMKSKKVLAVVLTSILALSTFTGCGNAKSQETTAEEMTAEQTTSEMETVKQEESTQQEDSESAAGDDGTVREDLTALEVAKLMGNGTNLGNTMEAYGHLELGTTAEVSAYETLWGQPVTTQEMLNGMKEAGFHSYSNRMDECYEMTNKINQTFVDTVRSTGGNNEQRFLLMAGYNTDIEHTCDDRYVMPTDSAKDKLLVSVHYYNPWSYCGTASGEQWGTISDYEDQNRLLEMLTKFTDKGYGVIIGEYAVMPAEAETIKDCTAEYVNNFLDNCDLYGYCPMLWDCSYFYIREDLKFVDEDLKNLYVSRNVEAQATLTEEQIQENAKKNMEEALANAPEAFELNVDMENLDGAVAWIMFNSKDWKYTYSAGDTYSPDSIVNGMVATDVEVTGEGTYTVALDFTGTEDGYAISTAFSALAVSNGELLYPGYVMDIKEVLVNGEPYELVAKPYTTSDDRKCTRVNLYNEWVGQIPEGARTIDGDASNVSAVILDNETLGDIKTLEITFDYVAP